MSTCAPSPNGGPSAQPFPSVGILGDHLDWTFDRLIAALTGAPQRPVYPYVVDTVRRGPDGRFAQEGGSPNLQGGCITLCACMHKMRTWPGLRDPRGVWVAGISGSSFAPKQSRRLFYLMYVDRRAESQFDMWMELPEETREAKSAATDGFGDLYEPLSNDLRGEARYDVRSYRTPPAGHVHEDASLWQKDISYQDSGRRPVLLAGRPQLSWIWSQPRVRLREARRSRNPGKSLTLDAFLQRLEPERP